VLAFLAIWFGVNIVFGVGSIAIGAEGASVAWQAHIGGFVGGLLAFAAFDPVPAVPMTENRHGADAQSSDDEAANG
jgi:membrane associated rhomboid family serine protease